METLDTRTDGDAVQELYNNAKDTDTLTDQESALAEMATEVGTTLDALRTAHEQRAAEAAVRIAELRSKQDPSTYVGNIADDWHAPKQ